MVNVVVIILSSYFFLAERDRIIGFWKKYLPENGGRYYENLKGDVRRLIGGYFLAQFKIMFMVALILLAGFVVLGIRYAFLLAILIAALDFLPLFGTGTVLLPWAVVKVLSGEYMLAAGPFICGQSGSTSDDTAEDRGGFYGASAAYDIVSFVFGL